MADGHPAWQELLKDVPESLHPVVTPILQKWDQGVKERLEQHTAELKKYEGFKQFVDQNVDPNWLVEAADIAWQLENDPKAFVQKADQVFNLGFNLDGSQQQPVNNPQPDDFGDFEDTGDITKHPQFAQVMQQLNSLQESVTGFTSKQEQEKQAAEFDQFITKMHDQHGDFDDNYITALMANGQSFPNALSSYQDFVARAVGGNADDSGDNAGDSNEQTGSDGAPVVMGGDTAGSGLPEQPISFGTMKTGDLEDMVAQFINAGNNDS